MAGAKWVEAHSPVGRQGRTWAAGGSGAHTSPPETGKWYVLTLVRPFRWWLLAYGALVLVSAALGAVYPLLYRALINRGLGAAPPRTAHVDVIVRVAVLTGVLTVVGAAVSMAATWCSATLAERLGAGLRVRLLEHTLRMPLAFFERQSTGDLISKMNNEISGVQQAVSNIIGGVLSNVALTVLMGAGLVLLSWRIGLVLLISLPLSLVLVRSLSAPLTSAIDRYYRAAGIMNAFLAERLSVGGAQLVKTYGDPEQELNRFARMAAEVASTGIQQTVLGQAYSVWVKFWGSVATATVFGVGGVLVAHGSLNLGTLVALGAYLSGFYGPLTKLANVKPSIIGMKVALQRVVGLLALEPEDEGDMAARVASPAGGVGATIEFRHVTCRRSPTPAHDGDVEPVTGLASGSREEAPCLLKEVSFEIAAGEKIAIVGPNGAGKTSVARLITGLLRPVSGSVLVDGRDVSGMSARALQESVALVAQDVHLFHGSVRDNLTYGCENVLERELWVALEVAQAADIVRRLPSHLDSIIGERGCTLSGGERARLAAARALVRRPKILVLDEASAHLDRETETAFHKALLSALPASTVVFIAHHRYSLSVAERIFVLQKGAVVVGNSHERLLEQSEWYRMWLAN